MNEDPLPTEVTIDRGNLTTGVINSWEENLLNVNYLCTTIGLRISEHDAVEVYSPEEH